MMGYEGARQSALDMNPERRHAKIDMGLWPQQFGQPDTSLICAWGS